MGKNISVRAPYTYCLCLKAVTAAIKEPTKKRAAPQPTNMIKMTLTVNSTLYLLLRSLIALLLLSYCALRDTNFVNTLELFLSVSALRHLG